MPKVDIDYSNTIIYKILCKDQNVSDVYVGHTTNFVQRKYSHKQNCNNINSPYYNLKLYKTIRQHGNWENWEMTIVNFYNCKNHLEAREKEQEYFISLGATLNSIEPLPIKKSTLTTIPVINNEEKNNDFSCQKCNYTCTSKFNFNRHITTNKHQKKYIEQTNNYSCICGKKYKYSQGLSKHKQKCINQELLKIDSNLVTELINQNKEKAIILITLVKENNELKMKFLDGI